MRIRIVIVEVVAGADEQARRFGELGVERVARIGMADLYAGAGGLCAEQTPRLQNVGLAKTPLEVGVGCRIVRAIARLPPCGLCGVAFSGTR